MYKLKTRTGSLLLALVCIVGLLPIPVFAVSDTIKLDSFGMKSGAAYESAVLGRCTLHQMLYKAPFSLRSKLCTSDRKPYLLITVSEIDMAGKAEKEIRSSVENAEPLIYIGYIKTLFRVS